MRVWTLLLALACGADAPSPAATHESSDDRSEPLAAEGAEADETTRADDESAPPTEPDERTGDATNDDESEVRAEPNEDTGDATEDEGAEVRAEPDEGDEMDATQPSTPGSTREPSVFTRVMFDLRGMPHRGPHDVDREMIRMRTEHLMQQMREAAGDPEPRLTYRPGVSVFRAEFYGSERDALAQCRRAVRRVSPPVDRSRRSARAALREPRATRCVPVE